MSRRWGDLLREPIFGVRRGEERGAESLPGVLASVSRAEPLVMTGLRAHQEHAWHAFLVQLAAVALHRAGAEEAYTDEANWIEALRALTEGDSAFCLVAEDLSEPAFMQPPVPEGKLSALSKETAFPDELSVLVTTRNHDLKAPRMRHATPELWAYTLVSLQTMEGFSGRDNYGIARMNSGFGSRPSVGIEPTAPGSSRFLRDLRLALSERSSLIERHGYQGSGPALLWTLPWDGKEKPLSLGELDPFFIEICRRVRLSGPPIVARYGSTKAPRVEAKEAKGDTGDLWTPVKREEGSALTISAEGFSYRRLHELFFDKGKWVPSKAQELSLEDGEPIFVTRALARGQGKTEGWHSREVPIGRKARSTLFDRAQRESLGKRSEGRIARAGEVRLKVLKPALLCLLQGGPESLNFKDDRANPWLDRFEAEVDAEYFGRLFEESELGEEAAEERWERFLMATARRLFEEATEALPIPEARHYRAIAAAERAFYGASRKVLPHLVRIEEAPIEEAEVADVGS